MLRRNTCEKCDNSERIKGNANTLKKVVNRDESIVKENNLNSSGKVMRRKECRDSLKE